MVVDHFSALEADFCRFYSIDLPAAVWAADPPLSVRRLEVLIGGLPADSKLVRDITPPHPHPGWGMTEELLAALVEHTSATNALLFNINRRKGDSAQKAIRVPRPWDTKTKRQATSAEMVSFFGGAVSYTPRGGDS